ncbi:MAG: type VI secretion system tip protein VgrG, partial [Aquabacterium sp.]
LVTSANYELDFGEHESAETDAASGFVCRLQAVPKKIRYQPARITPRPFVQGPQTAIVTSGADKQGVDKYGRVKVRFPWVRTSDQQQDSCWVRVSQGWASKNFGMMALPRVDDEVVVSFLEGDPDRPLITGRVYNAESMPPYPLPDQATTMGILSRSFDSTAVGDSNELRFDDKAGAEHLWLQAQRDYNLNVRNDATTTVGNNVVATIGTNSTTSIGSNSALTIGQAASVTIGADTHVDIATDALVNLGGAMQLNIGSQQQTNISANAGLTVGANTEINSGANFNVAAGAAMNLVAGAMIVIDAGAMLTLKVGGSSIMISEAGVDITGKMVNINCGGGGGGATKAQKVNPPKPKKAEKPAEHKDPINLQTAGKKQ